MLNNKNVFVTGGTGTFGTEFIKYILKNFKIKRLVIFSRDEWKQNELKNIYPEKNIQISGFSWRYKRLSKTTKSNGCTEIVIATLKQVPAAEYDL